MCLHITSPGRKFARLEAVVEGFWTRTSRLRSFHSVSPRFKPELWLQDETGHQAWLMKTCFCQVWGESAARFHLPAARQITRCRQKQRDLRVHQQPHWGPLTVLTRLEGGESPAPPQQSACTAGLQTPLCLLQVSHVFCSYGPGVRYVHFLHKLKTMFLNGFYNTMFTDSAVIVRPTKSCS